jgi:acyl carrier protein
MTEKSVDRLYQIVQRTLGVAVEALSEESSPMTLDAWDSLNHLNLVMAIEEEFGVQLSSQDVVNMRSLMLIRKGLRDRGVKI